MLEREKAVYNYYAMTFFPCYNMEIIMATTWTPEYLAKSPINLLKANCYWIPIMYFFFRYGTSSLIGLLDWN